MARACMHIVLRRSADACLIVPILADHPGGAARCHAVRVVRAGLPLRPCRPSGHSREQEVAGEYPYVLARKVWLYPFWAGCWPPNRSNLLPPWLEGDRLDRTTGATHIGCDNREPYTPSLAAATRLVLSFSVSHLPSWLYPSHGRDWPPNPSDLGDCLGLPPRAPFPGPPLWGDVASGGSRRSRSPHGVCRIGSRGRVGKSPIGLHTAIRVASLPLAA